MKKLMMTSMLCLAIFSTMLAQTWLTDMDQALKQAKEDGRKIVLAFQGSDWCAPCIKLEKKVWESEEFKTYAQDHFVLVKADFPRRKKNKLNKEQSEKNNKLFEKYNKQGAFPLVVIFNEAGEVLGQAGYNKMNASEYVNMLASF